MQKFLIVFLLFFNQYLWAQDTIPEYQFPEKVPSQYLFKATEEMERMMKSVPEGYNPKNYKKYAEVMSYSKKYTFLSGEVYLGWNELENYLNDIAEKLIPSDKVYAEGISVYPRRDADYNAYSLHDGTLFINIGYLADLNNEACLALVLAHEMAHYYNNDNLKAFFRKTDGKPTSKQKRNDANLLFASMNRQQEKSADSLAFIFANNAGYNILNGVSNFYQFISLDKKQEIVAGKKSLKTETRTTTEGQRPNEKQTNLEKLLATHPENQERIANLLANYKRMDKKGEADFQVDRDLFIRLRKQARIETLRLLLASFKYSECAERAFIYHLSEPDNRYYIYFLLEGIRRNLVFKPEYSNKGFLVDEYPGIFKRGQGILHDLTVLVRDSSSYKGIVAKHFLDSIHEFESYNQAFDYFSKLAIEKDITESYLTIALFHSKNDSLKNYYLSEYLTKPSILNPEYANVFKNNSIQKQLATYKKEVLLVENVSFERHSYNGIYTEFGKSEYKSRDYIAGLKAYYDLENKNVEVLGMYSLSRNNLNQAIKYKDAIKALTYLELYNSNKNNATNQVEEYTYEDPSVTEKKPKQKSNRVKSTSSTNNDLFLLDPLYYYLFVDNEIAQLSYAKVTPVTSEKFNTKRVAVSVCVGFYALPALLYLKYALGSSKFSFETVYFNYNPALTDKRVFFYSEKSNSKITQSSFINSVCQSRIQSSKRK